MMPIERNRCVILGVNEEREHGGRRLPCALGRVRKKHATNATLAKMNVHHEAADQTCRQRAIAWESLRLIRRKIIQRDTRCGESEIACQDTAVGADGDEAIRQVASDVLCNLLPKIPVERFDTAREAIPVVISERLNDDLLGQREVFTSVRCRSNARFNASFGSGGLRMAAAIAR